MVNEEIDNLFGMTFRKIKNWVIIVLGFIIFILLYQSCEKDRTWATNDKLVRAAYADTLQIWRDKDSLSHAKIAILSSENISTFTELQNTKEEVRNLQKLVKENKDRLKPGSSVTIISTSGEVSGKFPTTIIDTSKTKNQIFPVYPRYDAPFNFKGWVWGDIKAGKDETAIQIKYKDSLSFVLGQEKTGFLGLGKRKPFVEATSYNPYNSVEKLRSYQVTPLPRKKFVIGPTVSYGFGTASFTPQFFIGVGGTFNLIQF